MPRLQDEARLQMDIKAAKTVIITIMAFSVCYLPNVCIGIWILFNSEKFVMYVSWPGQVFHLCLFLSSAINPFIYCLRLRRFRCALKQLLSNPCGRTPFQETNNKRQIRQRIPHQVPRGEKNMDESNQAILMFKPPHKKNGFHTSSVRNEGKK